MTDIPTITQEEAVEVRARELALACANEACRNMDGKLDFAAMTRHFAKALSPNMDHAVGGVREALRPFADLAALGDSGKWLDAAGFTLMHHHEYVGCLKLEDLRRARSALSTPPVNQDAVREALVLARHTIGDLRNGFSKSVDPARWVEQLQSAIDKALATPPLDNTGLDAATVERCARGAERLDLIGDGYFDDTATVNRNQRLASAIRALASGDRS